MTTGNKEGQPVTESEQRLVLSSPEALLLPRWFSALHDVAADFTVNTFGEEPRAGVDPKSPLNLVQDGNFYRWQWREVLPVEDGEHLQFMEMFLRPSVYKGKLNGSAHIFLSPETGVRFDGEYIETANLENRVHWKSKSISLNASRSTIEKVAGDFGEALPRVWTAIGKHKESAPENISFWRNEIAQGNRRNKNPVIFWD